MRLLFIVFLLLVSPINCLAGYLGESLQEKINNSSNTDTEISVIVYFKSNPVNPVSNRQKMIKRADFKDTIAFKEARKAMRKQHIESLKLDADFSSKQFKEILKLYKKKVNRELWLINGLAVNLSPDLINTLSSYPKVDHIELDRVITL